MRQLPKVQVATETVRYARLLVTVIVRDSLRSLSGMMASVPARAADLRGGVVVIPPATRGIARP